MPQYDPVDASQSPRFVGIRTFMRVPHVTDHEDVDVALIGIPFATGATYRVGARFGPAAVREASIPNVQEQEIIANDLYGTALAAALLGNAIVDSPAP